MAKLGACSTSAIQAIELRKLTLSKVMAARISQTTGVSGRWLLKGEPTQPMVNEKGHAYSVRDFVSSSVQYHQFSQSKESGMQERLEWHNQLQAVELEEILNRSIKLKKWPVVKLMWTLFRDSALKELGLPVGKVQMDDTRAAKSFSSRWEQHERNADEDGGIRIIQRDAVRIVQDKEVTFTDSILAQVHAHHPEAKDYWSPVLDAVKATKKSVKRPRKKRKKR